MSASGTDAGTGGGSLDSLAGCGEFVAALAAAAASGHASGSRRPAAEGLEARRRAARARLVDLLHYAPPLCDLDVEPAGQDAQYGDHIGQRVSFRSAPWSRVPCDLLIPSRPRDGHWPAPAVVALHCHSGVYRWGREKIVEPASGEQDAPFLRRFRERAYGGRGYANALARRGYVVAVIDAFFFGDRRLRYAHGQWPEPYRSAETALEPDSDPWLAVLNRAHNELQPRVAGALFQAGATWPGVHVWDDRRTIDFLLTRPEVDASRIGCVGLSVGGYRAVHLAAADERVRAAVAVGWMCEFGALWPVSRWPHTVGWMHYVPGLYGEQDLPDTAALTCPRPLLIMQGRQDTLFPLDGVERALAKIEGSYAEADVASHFEGRLYDAPHRFDMAMQEDAFDWFDRWL